MTGVLADALNWAAISEDTFNEILEKIPDAADRANYIMDTLARTYGDAADAFYENNAAIVANRDAQSELDKSLAQIGGAVSEVKTEFMEMFGPGLAEGAKRLADALSAIAGVIREINGALNKIRDNKAVHALGNLRDFLFGGIFGSSGSYALEPASGLFSAASFDIPHFAQGGVVAPNNPFLAVVGDNRREAEVISPISTIRKAIREEISVRGLENQPIIIPITLELDGAILARKMYTYNSDEVMRRGPSFVG